mmetsp:Transcript_42478/g.123473  ORF Transcript_42478/g.123473 Transcript_42478/m.123473 type:complete len:418 (-) Transcript_42478:1707-2960(-)
MCVAISGICWARPKSQILAFCWTSSRMFIDFKSRCTTRCECKKQRPSAVWQPIIQRCCKVNGWSLRLPKRRSCRDPPGMNSVTTSSIGGCTQAPMKRTRRGCLSRRKALTSFRISSKWATPLIFLMATSCPFHEPRKTAAEPPAPSCVPNTSCSGRMSSFQAIVNGSPIAGVGDVSREARWLRPRSPKPPVMGLGETERPRKPCCGVAGTEAPCGCHWARPERPPEVPSGVQAPCVPTGVWVPSGVEVPERAPRRPGPRLTPPIGAQRFGGTEDSRDTVPPVEPLPPPPPNMPCAKSARPMARARRRSNCLACAEVRSKSQIPRNRWTTSAAWPPDPLSMSFQTCWRFRCAARPSFASSSARWGEAPRASKPRSACMSKAMARYTFAAPSELRETPVLDSTNSSVSAARELPPLSWQ